MLSFCVNVKAVLLLPSATAEWVSRVANGTIGD
jgi:hypothetical protein